MSRIKPFVIALLCLVGFQQVEAQSDVELTDSISSEWGGGVGGGITPSIPSNPVTSLSLSQTSIIIKGGERHRLTAIVNGDASNKRVIWSVEDKEIARVLEDGTVSGLKTGNTTVRATSESNPEMTASCSVTVTSDYVAPSSGWILPWGKEEAWEMSYLYYEQSKYKEPILDGDGNNWKELDYNDSAWRTLTGPMGSPGITYSSYNYEWKGEYNCFCLRRTFNLPTVGQGVYTFRMQHDDDIVVYLNGAEVINETGWTDEKISTYTIPSNKFIVGENILAIFIKQNHGGAFLDYSLYYEGAEKPSDKFDIGFLPDVPFEFFYDAKLYDEATQAIPNHEAANLAGHNLKLTANIPSYNDGNYLRIEERCEGYIDKWNKGAAESGAYFYRSGSDCMTIVCRVKPKNATGNSSDLIANRGGGYNYMFRVGEYNKFFLHTGTAFQESRAMDLPISDESQVLAVRVDGTGDYIQLDNFTTGESKRVSGVNWGGGGNVMKFFYNDDSEYYTGDVYWMYYSKSYISDEDLEGLISYGLRKSYSLTYRVDGEVYNVVTVEEGSAISPIDEPVKEGYTFSGWQGLPATMPAGDVTVSGTFSVNYYDVIYMIDGEVYEVISVAYGENIVPIKEPTKDGYIFSGWSGIPSTMPAQDITVTGTFRKKQSYNLTYLVDGEVYNVVTVEEGSAISPIDEPVKEGYTFSGWQGLPATMPAGDVTVSGTFSVNYYDVIYMIDGEVYEVISVAYGENIVPIKEPTKEGYIFSGWSEIPSTMPAQDVTITGTFRKKQSYNLTYLVDGEIYKVLTVEEGSTIEPVAEPAKEGYTFSGWQGLPATMPAGDVTVNGTFSLNSYTVIYKIDGKVYKSETVEYGSAITLIDAPIKEGYTFSGWSDAPATMPAGDVVVEGYFTVNHYTLTYIVDGEVYSTESIVYGSTIEPIAEPAREGYTFSGWQGLPATMPARDVTVSGSFTANSYELIYLVDGEEYKRESVKYGASIVPEPAPSKEGHTFSGWSEIPVVMPACDVLVVGTFTVNIYTVIYIVDGKEYARVDVPYGENIELIDEPAKENYVFSGWSEVPETMPAQDIIVTGSFAYTGIITTKTTRFYMVHMIDGTILYENLENLDLLPSGVYVINGQKVYIK